MICYPDQLGLLLTMASKLNAIGPEYLYIFPGLNVYTLEQSLQTMDGTFDGNESLLFPFENADLLIIYFLYRVGCQ